MNSDQSHNGAGYPTSDLEMLVTAPGVVLHILPNAHLDPVWLWDWREGLTEGITTVRTVLDLMDEFPDLTFIRGESAIYRHIQKTAPAVFERVLQKIEAGRWDVVGGTVIQPDTNLPSTETLCRIYESGLRYFAEELGVRPRIAWQADSFGHSAGLPNILAGFGMEGLAFTRPQQAEFPLDSPAFWWEGEGGAQRVLAYRQYWPWYCSERGNLTEILDHTLKHATQSPLRQVGLLMGLGNHGGGPTRRHLLEIQLWRDQHPEVDVRFSTLHHFFGKLREESAKVPVVKGELGYCLRGCYSSVQRFKAPYRRAEAAISEAETTRALLSLNVESDPVEDLAEAWDALAFNAFHDILPGTSIERASDEQSDWVGGALHQARRVRFEALNRLSAQVDTTVPAPARPDLPRDIPFLVWNPLPRAYSGLVELEGSLDYRPIYAFENRVSELAILAHDDLGEALPAQIIQTEHTSMPHLPWRARVLVPVSLPAWGWQVIRVGCRELAPPMIPVPRPCIAADRGIGNEEWQVRTSAGVLEISRHGRRLGDFTLRTVEDPWGSWGGMSEEPESFQLDQVRETWRLAAEEILETGPLRSRLWTRWKAGDSWLDLTFSLARDQPEVRVEGRLLWNERSARLQWILPGGGPVQCDVPGGRLLRSTAPGQVPMGRWITWNGLGLATDVLGDYDARDDELRVTLARASRYANDVPTARAEKLWQPAVDCGELRFQAALFHPVNDPGAVADALLHPAAAVPVSPGPGLWQARGSLGSLAPESVRLLSLERVDGRHLKVRVQSHLAQDAILHFHGQILPIPKLSAGEIRTTIFIQDSEGLWQPAPASAVHVIPAANLTLASLNV